MPKIHDNTQFRSAQIGAMLARHYPEASPFSIAAVVCQMQAATRTAKKFSEDQCNYDLGDPDDAKSAYARRRRAQDRKEAAINAELVNPLLTPADERADDALKMPNPATVDLGGDPRGPCGRLHVPGMGRGDGWGDGFAIY